MSKKKKNRQNAGAPEETTLSSATEEMGHEVPKELDPERDAIYREYEQQTGLADSASETAETPEEPELEVSEEETTAEASPEEEATDKKEYVKSEEEEIKVEDEKTVPHGAFHEEREKRKAAQRKISTLEDKVRELETQVPAESGEAEEAGEYLGEDAAKIKNLEQQLQELQNKENARGRKEEDTRKQGEVDQLKTLVDTTDVQLTKDGFPGFKFMTSQITEELNKLIKDDPDNAYLDNPEGWAKIYRDKVFPEIKGMFVSKDKAAVLGKKKAAKEAAALIGTSGKDTSGASGKKKSDEWSYDDYLELRKENSAV